MCPPPAEVRLCSHHSHPAGVPPTCPSPHWGFTHLPVLPLPPPTLGSCPPAHVHIPPPSAWPPSAASLTFLQACTCCSWTVPSVLCSPHGSRPDYFRADSSASAVWAAIRPARLHWGAAPQAWTQPPGPALACSHHCTCDRAPGSKASATCFRPGLPGQLLPHLLRICAY